METGNLFLILIAIFGFLSFLILRPYMSFILFGAIVVFVSFPLYRKIKSKLKNKFFSALLIIITMLLIVIIPAIFISLELFTQAKEITLGLGKIQLKGLEEQLSLYRIDIAPIKESISNFSATVASYLISNIFIITKATVNIFVGAFIMLFTMYYLYLDGEKMTLEIKRAIPLNKKYQDYIVAHTYQVMQALLLGIFFSALMQGFFGGIGFMLFGFPNAIFWGFVMMFLSIIPFLGPHFVYVPASLYLMFRGNFLAGLGLLIYGVIVVNNLDNIVRPKIVGMRAKIHPMVVILGVIGGISFMGMTGMVLGPLVLAIFIEMLKVYNTAQGKRRIDSYF